VTARRPLQQPYSGELCGWIKATRWLPGGLATASWCVRFRHWTAYSLVDPLFIARVCSALPARAAFCYISPVIHRCTLLGQSPYCPILIH